MSPDSRATYQVVLEVGFVSFLAVTSAALNILSCVVVWRNLVLRTWHNLFTINLIVIDLLCTVFSMTFTVLVLGYGKWLLNNALCHLSGYVNAVLACVMINTLALFSFSRYQLFVCPRKYLGTWNKKKCLTAIGIAWAVSLTVSSPPLFGWGEYRFLPKNAVCFLNFNASQTFSAIYVYVFLALPLTFAVFHLVRLYIALRSHRRHKPEEASNVQFRQTLRAAQSMLVLSLAFFVCWMPAFVVFALFASEVYLSRGLCLFSTLMIYIFAVILPLIYAATNSVFKIGWRIHFRMNKITRSSVEPERGAGRSGHHGDHSQHPGSHRRHSVNIVEEDVAKRNSSVQDFQENINP